MSFVTRGDLHPSLPGRAPQSPAAGAAVAVTAGRPGGGVLLIYLPFAAAWLAYLTLDLRALARTGAYENRPGRVLKLVSAFTVAALVFAPASGPGEHDRLRLAFAFTVVGDICFSLLKRFVAGVSMFGVVQVVLTVRHLQGFAWSTGQVVLLLGLLALGVVVFRALAPRLGRIAPVVGAYIALSAVSVWAGAGLLLRDTAGEVPALPATIGMVLLSACDVCTTPAAQQLTFRRRSEHAPP